MNPASALFSQWTFAFAFVTAYEPIYRELCSRVHNPIHACNSIDSAMANDYDMHGTVATVQRIT